MSDTLLARLEAESAIRRLVGLYCDAVNRSDPEAAGDLFASDARIRIDRFPELNGADAIRAGFRQTFGHFGFVRQQCDVALIDVAGGSARARIQVIEASHRAGEQTVSLIYGFYEDEYVLLEQGWRFYRRRYTMQFRTLLEAKKLQLAEGLDLAFKFAP